ncbi:MAG: OsmC family protein [Anaerolineae bacterium]
MDASVTWQGDMGFSGVADSGHEIYLDADESVGGHGEGARPLELMALSLAGCTAMDVISIMRKKRQEVTGFTVKVHANRTQDHPKVFTAIHITYVFQGKNIDPKAVERSMALSAERYCPAQAMLSQVAPTSLSYEIHEA